MKKDTLGTYISSPMRLHNLTLEVERQILCAARATLCPTPPTDCLIDAGFDVCS